MSRLMMAAYTLFLSAQCAGAFTFRDTFTAADGTWLKNHYSDTGHRYQSGLTSDWSIQSGHAVYPGGAFALDAQLNTEYTLKYPVVYVFDFINDTSLSVSGIVFRFSATTDNLYIYAEQYGGPPKTKINLVKTEGGSSTYLAYYTFGARYTGTHAVKIYDTGSTVRVAVDINSPTAYTQRISYDTTYNNDKYYFGPYVATSYPDTNGMDNLIVRDKGHALRILGN